MLYIYKLLDELVEAFYFLLPLHLSVLNIYRIDHMVFSSYKDNIVCNYGGKQLCIKFLAIEMMVIWLHFSLRVLYP
jgi:hypothetical protein